MKTITVLLCFSASVFAADPPEFYRDVVGILQQHCQGCHRPGEIGPMPLRTYAETRPWTKAIRQAVLSRKMPPWSPDRTVNHFRNDPSLSQQEIDTLVSWADAGSPAGNPKDAPAPRAFPQEWTMGTPDVVFEMPEPVQVPATGTIEYTYVIVPSGFKEDRWVSAAELRPGNRAVMHHGNIFVRAPGSTWLRGYPIGTPFVPKEQLLPGGTNAGAGPLEQAITTYVPGRQAARLPEGYAKLIPAGSDLVFQVHYTANGREASDRSKIGFVFSNGVPSKRVLSVGAASGGFVIPAGDANYPVSGSSTLAVDCELVQVYPHMHLRGKSMTLWATFPNGERTEVLRVPHYDFNWQMIYELSAPTLLPKGTILKAEAAFDNSANNPYNPDPKSDVRWGDQSWQEMMVGFFDVAVPLGTDPRSLLERRR